MDSLIGFVGADFVLLIADTSQARSILKMKGNEDKIVTLDPFKLAAAAGEQGDRENFTQFIQKNLALYALRTGTPLTMDEAATYTRHELSKALRRNPYQTNLLLAGYDKDVGASLYYLDYMGSLHKMPFGAHGYASNFVLGIFDRYYKPNLSLEDGLKLANTCIAEIQTRFLIAQPSFIIKIVTKDGIKIVRDLPEPTPK
jgi:20S proteasome subunit beta 4